jgi:hypothetical protein
LNGKKGDSAWTSKKPDEPPDESGLIGEFAGSASAARQMG